MVTVFIELKSAEDAPDLGVGRWSCGNEARYDKSQADDEGQEPTDAVVYQGLHQFSSFARRLAMHVNHLALLVRAELCERPPKPH
jgi:hypothetical protein